MDPLSVRVIKAGLLGFVSFLIAGFLGCEGGMYLVRNSQDGQAGMGAAFGGFYLGCFVGMVVFVVSLVRSRRRVDRDGVE